MLSTWEVWHVAFAMHVLQILLIIYVLKLRLWHAGGMPGLHTYNMQTGLQNR